MNKFTKRRNMIALIVAVLLCGSLASANPGYTSTSNSAQPKEGNSAVMGIDVYVHLFNMKLYRDKILPAYRTFVQKDDPAPTIALMRDCIKTLQANPKAGEDLLLDAESFEGDIGIITGKVFYSPDSGRTSNQGNTPQAKEVRHKYAKDFFFQVIFVLCLPRDKGVNPEQNMSRTPLIRYLYKNSEWLEGLFTGLREVKGGSLELPMYESSEIFTKQDVEECNNHLAKVPTPEENEIKRMNDEGSEYIRTILKQNVAEGSADFKARYDSLLALSPLPGTQLKNELDNLRRMVKIALNDPDFVLLYSVSI